MLQPEFSITREMADSMSATRKMLPQTSLTSYDNYFFLPDCTDIIWHVWVRISVILPVLHSLFMWCARPLHMRSEFVIQISCGEEGWSCFVNQQWEDILWLKLCWFRQGHWQNDRIRAEIMLSSWEIMSDSLEMDSFQDIGWIHLHYMDKSIGPHSLLIFKFRCFLSCCHRYPWSSTNSLN